ncbi:hypothetical protein H5410_047307 [Solanum commersonii]|uniref:Uncharacterized protein n=1 Tax=Solanum commersonii TaxID=4109 RepID=A0A9J5XEQ1_SOLCO|nr:hypothetical protein H5410_047307 [Solanum commersonii]
MSDCRISCLAQQDLAKRAFNSRKRVRIGTTIPPAPAVPKGKTQRLYFIEVTGDRMCLVYALIKDLPINVGTVLKSPMWKARVHRGRSYPFGGLITIL